MRPGFADPVLESQRTFRIVLDAVAHPGRIFDLARGPEPPAPLHPAAAAVALTLVDFETPLWVDLTVGAEARDWLRFHTGAAIVDRPGDAIFAFVADAERPPVFEAFALGSDERPERSATVIVQVEDLRAREGRRLTGPGIAGETQLAVRGVPAAFWEAMRENHARFPRGVDVLLSAGTRLAALPRTTRVAGV
jgi:alpha-D-ribose 1-methylphosphonate 5-triphosphate synthase subunit PhnH